MVGGVSFIQVGYVSLTGIEFVYETIKKVWLIRKRLKMTQILDKSYINVEQEFLSFILMIGSIWKAVMRFGKK